MKFYFFLTISLFTIFSTSCKMRGKSKPFQAHFWTSSNWGEDLYVMVNDTIKGKLPYLAQAPQCGAANLESGTLSLSLTAGKHEIVIQDKEAKIFFVEVLTLENSMDNVTIGSSSSFDETASKRVRQGDCLIEEIYRK